jgi:hypothetical protein
MAISLASLRVEADFDAGKDIEGARQKEQADARMVDSGNKLAGSLDNTNRRLGDHGTTAEKLARSLDPAYNAEVNASSPGMSMTGEMV